MNLNYPFYILYSFGEFFHPQSSLKFFLLNPFKSASSYCSPYFSTDFIQLHFHKGFPLEKKHNYLNVIILIILCIGS